MSNYKDDDNLQQDVGCWRTKRGQGHYQAH